MSKSVGVSILIISGKEDHVAAIDSALRDTGVAARCTRIEHLNDLQAALDKTQPQLMLLFGKADSAELAHAAKVRSKISRNLPLLLVTDKVDENIIAAAMTAGARDVVSLANLERFKSVCNRELRAFRLEKALESVMGSARQYKQELHTLKQLTGEAIAEVQEGIIVNANPAWLELFGLEDDGELIGVPIMDYCAEASRPALKGALVACMKNKWADSKIDLKCIRGDGSEMPLSVSLENADFDGESAVRLLVSPEETVEDVPEVLVEHAIQRDQATGLYNRNFFIDSLESRVATAPAGGVRALALIRPDRFSKAFDELGTMGTEAVVNQLAAILREFVQPSDIYGRFGGTLFGVLLERGTMSDAEAWAEQLLTAIKQSVFEHNKHSTAITCSIGMCEVGSKGANVAELLGEAEHACQAGRRAGGDRVQLNESSGKAKLVRQDDDEWVPKIRSALMENRLRLEHQPIGSLNSDIDGAFDTLVRMLDEDGNTVPAGQFMTVAERTGLSKNIDRWVIGASLSFCAAGNAELVFVRLSRDSLLDETLLDWLINQTTKSGAAPAKMCFEISEEIAVKHMRQAQLLAEGLRKSGFKFAVEHFGTAEDSARLISLIPMEFVKIDGSLMQGLHKNVNVQTTVKELARQASDRNILTIAERVQDANTMAVLWQLGIAFIQGNYVQTQEIVIEDTSRSGVSTPALQLDEETGQPQEATA